MRKAEERNIDYAVLRSCCPHCVKGRAEACGGKAEKDKERSIPAIGIDCMHMHTKRAEDEEKGMRVIVMDSRAKMIVSKVVTSKEVFD